MEQQNNELEEMRQQLSLLNKKLEKQEIVNEKMIRQAMLSKMSFMKRYTWFSYFALVFVAIYFFILAKMALISWPLYAFTVVYMLVVVFTGRQINHYNDKEFLSNNLIDTARHMLKQRQLRKKVRFFSAPVLLFVWAPWVCFELYGLTTAEGATISIETFYGGIIGGIIGMIGGFLIGASLYRKMQRINQDIINQINDLQGDEVSAPSAKN